MKRPVTGFRNDGRAASRSGSAGFALILAILALMLLTFLGLTLAATTSTELQIATNHRWSEQARYNAEAGLEAAKRALRDISDWNTVVWPARTTSYSAGTTTLPSGVSAVFTGERLWESGGCDARGGGVGFGRVFIAGSGAGAVQYQDITNVNGVNLNGAVTVWARRPLAPQVNGQFQDSTIGLVLTAEGTAPYSSGVTGAFAASNRAVRIVETQVAVTNNSSPECGDPSSGGPGLSQSGAGYRACVPTDPANDVGASVR